MSSLLPTLIFYVPRFNLFRVSISLFSFLPPVWLDNSRWSVVESTKPALPIVTTFLLKNTCKRSFLSARSLCLLLCLSSIHAHGVRTDGGAHLRCERSYYTGFQEPSTVSALVAVDSSVAHFHPFDLPLVDTPLATPPPFLVCAVAASAGEIL